MDRSRTEYSARNMTAAMVGRVLAILAGFCTRIVFTHTLSQDYVGVNGLFTDILNVLALTELGAGTAITYALYQPIAQGDIEKQKSLMGLFRTFYRLVALLVLAGGLLVIPFMDKLIKNPPEVEHLTLIYLLYLGSSAASYLMVYKRTLVDAHQLSYIGVLYQSVFRVLQNVLQIIVLLATRNFILFVSMLILCTLLNNLAISAKADRLFPYLRDRDVQKLPDGERREIFKNTRAMLMHKIGTVMVNNTDNLLLSSLVGIVSTGLYSNYFLIIGSIRQVLEEVLRGITASVGNLGVERDKTRVRRIFEAAFFLDQWIYGLAAICTYELIDLVVSACFGAAYVFPRGITLILCINFYLTGMRQAALVFRDSLGVFWYDRYKSLAEAAINLIASILLGQRLGTAGIFLGTMVSTVATSLWVEPLMLYRHWLGGSAKPYFLRYGLYASVTFLLWYGVDALCRGFTGGVLAVGAKRLLVCVVVVDLAYLLLYHRTKEFKLLLEKGRALLSRWIRRSAPEEPPEEAGPEPSQEEALLLSLLARALDGEPAPAPPREGADWQAVADMAAFHGVLPLLYDPLAGAEDVPGAVKARIEGESRRIVLQSYRLLFLSRFLSGRLAEKGIPSAVLKGAAAAAAYPTPELRKSGDVDLLLPDPGMLEAACRVLEGCGCARDGPQDTLHHVSFTMDGIGVELHTMLVEPFDNAQVNGYLARTLSGCRVQEAEVMGARVPVLAPGYHAFQLLLHMLQHYLRAGFGLKLLCDWTAFWRQEVPEGERQCYLALVEGGRLKGFSDTVTLACCRYLGLERRRVEWMGLSRREEAAGQLLRDILEGGEFGRSSSERMVSLRSPGWKGYVLEFHHQMCLCFPKGSKCVLCWPALYAVTLFRFLRNNRRVRKVPLRAVLRKAGQRSKLSEKMGLWK